MKKVVAILVAVVLCLTFCVSAGADDSWTIFVYLCGADLESEAGLATGNMQEMISASAASNVRFIVQTGGAAEWNNGASLGTCGVSVSPCRSGFVGSRQRQHQRCLLR